VKFGLLGTAKFTFWPRRLFWHLEGWSLEEQAENASWIRALV